jgi:hypothetical protein
VEDVIKKHEKKKQWRIREHSEKLSIHGRIILKWILGETGCEHVG